MLPKPTTQNTSSASIAPLSTVRTSGALGGFIAGLAIGAVVSGAVAYKSGYFAGIETPRAETVNETGQDTTTADGEVIPIHFFSGEVTAVSGGELRMKPLTDGAAEVTVKTSAGTKITMQKRLTDDELAAARVAYNKARAAYEIKIAALDEDDARQDAPEPPLGTSSVVISLNDITIGARVFVQTNDDAAKSATVIATSIEVLAGASAATNGGVRPIPAPEAPPARELPESGSPAEAE